MNVEQTITDDLREVGAAVRPPPPPDAALLVRRAERARVRTRLRAGATVLLAAASVLAVIVLSIQLSNPKAGPSPAPQPTNVTPTPTTSPTALSVGAPLATWEDPDTGTLYIDGKAADGPAHVYPVRVGDLTIGWFGGPLSGTVAVYVGRKYVGTIRQVDNMRDIHVSSDHRTITWVAVGSDGRSGVVVVARVDADGVHELGRLQGGPELLNNNRADYERVFHVDDDGTVLYGNARGGHSWRPRGKPRPADVSPYLGGPAAGFPTGAHAVVLNPSASWGAWLTDPVRFQPDACPSCAPAEASGLFATIAFQQPHQPETARSITMPGTDAQVMEVYWESDTAVILEISEPNKISDRYVRCNVIEVRCEVAPTIR